MTRNLAGLTDAFVVAYSREHDIQAALAFCFALDDYAARRSPALGFDAGTLGMAVLQRRAPAPDVQAELAAVAQQHGFTANQLVGASKVPAIVAARQHAMATLRQRYSIAQVADALGISRSAVPRGVAAWRAVEASARRAA